MHTHGADNKNLRSPAITVPAGQLLFARGPSILPRVSGLSIVFNERLMLVVIVQQAPGCPRHRCKVVALCM